MAQTLHLGPDKASGVRTANGFTVVAHALANAGVRNIYGVIGIPVTELASAAQVLMFDDSIYRYV